MTTQRIDDVRKRAQRILQGANVLIEGHFDFGNGYHGRTYLNPHMLFCQPSTIWQLAQDLLDVLPYEISTQVQAVVGPATGGALLAHTLAGLLDGRRSLEHPPCMFAPVDYDVEEGLRLRSTYRAVLAGKKVLLADDVRNTGKTLSHCAELVRKAGGEVIATTQIYDRMATRRHARRPQRAAARVRRPRHLHVDDLPAVCSGGAVDLLLMPSLLRLRADDLARLRGELDRLHDSYNVPDSAADPVQFVWRYDDPARPRGGGGDRLRSGVRPARERARERRARAGAARAASCRLPRGTGRARGPGGARGGRPPVDPRRRPRRPARRPARPAGAAWIARRRVPGRRRSGERGRLAGPRGVLRGGLRRGRARGVRRCPPRPSRRAVLLPAPVARQRVQAPQPVRPLDGATGCRRSRRMDRACRGRGS